MLIQIRDGKKSDPRSGIKVVTGIRNKHPRSATLKKTKGSEIVLHSTMNLKCKYTGDNVYFNKVVTKREKTDGSRIRIRIELPPMIQIRILIDLKCRVKAQNRNH
jgi:hypothetical protein